MEHISRAFVLALLRSVVSPRLPAVTRWFDLGRQWYPVLAVKSTDPGRAHAVQVSLRGGHTFAPAILAPMIYLQSRDIGVGQDFLLGKNTSLR